MLDKVLGRLDIGFVVNDGFIILKDNHDGVPAKSIPTAEVTPLRPVADTVLKGHVLGENGEPFPGATIVEKGTGNGVVSGADGAFTLRVKSGATLAVTAIGYNVMEINAAAAEVIRLKAAVEAATGYSGNGCRDS